MQAPITFALEDAWPDFCDYIDIPEIIWGVLVTCDPLPKIVTTFSTIQMSSGHGLRSPKHV